MRKPDFSEIVAIVAKGERAHTRFQWEVGDALIRAIGRPSNEVRIEGSFAKLEACSEELKLHGYEYEAHTLRTLWQVAARYPSDSRYSLAWHVHHIAGHPEMLKAIVEGAPRNQKITQDYAASVMRGLALEQQRELEAETERRREAYEAAKREREEAEAEQKRAPTAKARQVAAERAAAAAQRQKRNQVPPKRKDIEKRKPRPEDTPLLIARASFARDLTLIRRSLTKLRETYEPLLRGFDEADLDNGHEELMTIAEAARAFAGVLRKDNGKAGHLSVVDNAS